jgi:RNA polymerase sigma factor (sigma-70 family)
VKRPRFEDKYQRDLDNAPDADDFPARKRIDRKQEADLVRAAQGRDPRLAEVARTKLLRAHRHRIDYQAKGKQNQFFDKDEAFQAGVVGYVQGLESFDPSKGFCLWTYVKTYVKGAILQARSDATYLWPVHKDLQDDLGSYRKKVRSLTLKLDREPTDSMVAHTMGVPIESVTYWRGLEQKVGRLGSPSKPGDGHGHENDEEGPGDYGEIISDDQRLDTWSPPCQSQWHVLTCLEHREAVESLLATLDGRSADLLRLRYRLVDLPLTDHERRNGNKTEPDLLPLSKVAECFRLSTPMVHQMEESALARLRKETPHHGWAAHDFISVRSGQFLYEPLHPERGSIYAEADDLRALMASGNGHARKILQHDAALPLLRKKYPALLAAIFSGDEHGD